LTLPQGKPPYGRAKSKEPFMTEFTIPDMECNGCVSTITRAIHALDPDAKITADLTTHHVSIDSPIATSVLREAIISRGFTVS
jgi:copper chaperone